MIIGTAGHIDHGKTALVRALTGVDTDRLPEEKRRGITIDLGFAPLDLPGLGTAGVVDVPGHEAFVRTMLAGATGIDLALLIVAADEGVMPQTREHVAILSLLGIRGGVVALTKRDLVDDEWLELVRFDVAELLAGGPLAAAPVVPTSVVTGLGLDELRSALAAAGAELEPRTGDDLFRMPIDRVFTVRGTGTVVTGTVWSGRLRRDEAVRVLPNDLTARVRGLQAHGVAREVAGPGTRLAVALAGVDHDAIERGSVLVASPAWAGSRVLRADISLLGGTVTRLSPRAAVRFHLGTSEVGARVVTAGGALSAGERKAGRIVLDAPIAARAGDRFVLRGGSPVATIGGGTIVDPQPAHRRPRPWTAPHDTPEHRLELMLEEALGDGIATDAMAVRLGVRPGAVEELVRALDEHAVRVGSRVYAATRHDTIVAELVQRVGEFHERNPLEPGATLQTLRGQIPGRPELVDHAVRAAVAAGALAVDGALVRRRGWAPELSDDHVALKRRLVDVLRSAGPEPPSLSELGASLGSAVTPLLRILEREGEVVPVEPDRYYSAEAVEALVARLRGEMASGKEYSPAELRDVIGLSRKYLIPFLEYCDRRGVTERRSNGRVLSGTQVAL